MKIDEIGRVQLQKIARKFGVDTRLPTRRLRLEVAKVLESGGGDGDL